MRDCKEKGRAKGPCLRGERNPLAKLTAKDVVEIRSRLATGERPCDIAKVFGVTGANITQVRYHTWQHIEAVVDSDDDIEKVYREVKKLRWEDESH